MPGPAQKPALAVVREGNPAHRPVPESVALPPVEFEEPDWSKELPESMAPKKPTEPEREDDESIEHFQQRMYRFEKKMTDYHLKRQAINGTRYVKKRASQEWHRIVPVLQKSVGLGAVDWSIVVDLCICVARLEWAEHELSREGLIVLGQRGPARNPHTTIASQYRTQIKTYIRELGLSPAARTGLPGRDDGPDDDDPFD